MKRKIRTYGDPILRQRAQLVPEVTASLCRLADDLLETMYAARGLGLAAQQVGETCALCVVDVPAELDVEEEGGPRSNPDVIMPLTLFNPVIRHESPVKISCEEGCLSFPDVHVSIRRSAEVTVDYIDREGHAGELIAKGLLARAIQHELDHLGAVLLVDRMSPVKKISLSGQLKKLKKETMEELGA
jgi:peptide deformylase